MRLLLNNFLILFLLLLSTNIFGEEKIFTNKVTDDITYLHYINTNEEHPLIAHILEINPYSVAHDFQIVFGCDKIGKLEKLSSICRKYNAICGINGSYFDKKRYFPIGYIINNKELIYKSYIHRACFSITDNREIIFGYFNTKVNIKVVENDEIIKEFLIEGINTPRGKNSIVLYTPHYGETTQTDPWGVEIVVKHQDDYDIINEIIVSGNTPIPKDGYVISLSGDKISLVYWLYVGAKLKKEIYLPDEWQQVNDLITGGPYLIKDGKIDVKVNEERFHGTIKDRHPRTAVGKTQDNKLLFFVIEGRQPKKSIGLTFEELAQFLLKFNIVEAIALDGGTSSGMFIKDRLVNSLIGDKEHPISNAILIIPADEKEKEEESE